MARFSYVNIELPEAGRLADLYGFANDLASCRSYCEKYMKTFPAEDTECYWTFVFVKYSRCFNGGIRRPFVGKIPIPLSPEEEQLHNSILSIRDKHLAHSVNDFERHRVRVWLNPAELGRKIRNVNIESCYLTGPKPELFDKLLKIIDKLFAWAEEEKKEEEAKLLPIVEKKFGLDQLYLLKPSSPEKVDESRITKPREKC
jgi:hypothetical protein